MTKWGLVVLKEHTDKEKDGYSLIEASIVGTLDSLKILETSESIY